MATSLLSRTLALAATAALIACGGGSSDPVASCTRATISTTGPGDTLNYFPADVGRSWLYGVDTGGTVTAFVSGTQVVDSETATVFTFMNSLDLTRSQDLVVKRPSGVYLLAGPSVDPIMRGMFPSLILPFPLAVMPKTQQAACTNLDVGDLDGDGKTDRADTVSSLAVLSTTETATLGVGTFTDVVHVRQDTEMTVRRSAAGSLTMVLTQHSWYAKGTGRIVAQMVLTTPGYPSSSETETLISTTAPAPAIGSPEPSLAQAAAAPEAGPGRGLEQLTLAVARRAFGARR